MRRILSIIICLSFISIPAYAQQYEWSSFKRGLNIQHTPINLPNKFGTVCENVRFGAELKSIQTRPLTYTYGTADASEAITSMHRLYLAGGTKVLLITHGDEIETGVDATGDFTNILDLTTGDYRWQWLTWHDIGIGTDGYNQPVKYDGSSASATYLGTCLATVSGTAGNPSGTYTYKVSYYTETKEVIFDVASNSVSPSSKQVTLSMIPIAPDTYGGEDVEGRKVYRVESGTWKLLSNGDIDNNTATTLTDDDVTAAGADYPESPNATYTPPMGKFCLIHKNRLFIANNPNYPSRIYYSEDGSHDVFLSTSYFNIRPNDGDEITFIKNLLGILTISKNNTIQKLYTRGDTPSSDWEISDPLSFIGCQAPYTAADSPIGIIYLADDGIYKFTGQVSTCISEAIKPVIQDISLSDYDNCAGYFYKNIFYLSYTSAITGASTNNRVLVLELSADPNGAYSIDILSINTFVAFSSGTDSRILYIGSSADGKVFSYGMPGLNEVVHKEHDDFTGTWDDMRYIPTGIPGGDENNPVLELGWTETIDDIDTTINNTSGDIDRPDTDGTYISQVLDIGAVSFDKLYWNEVFEATGCDATIAIRAGSSSSNCTDAEWSSEYSDPTGSDISDETAARYVQYRISLSTTDIDYTPTVVKRNNYNIRLTYGLTAMTAESSISMKWEGGWADLGKASQDKVLRQLQVYHEGSDGTLTITFENSDGDTDSFEIDLSKYPNYYHEYFTTGAFRGRMFKLKINYDDDDKLTIKKIVVIGDTEPLI